MILAIALLLRAGWALTRPGEAGLAALPDQVEYLTLGRNLLAGEGLNFTDPRFGTPVYAFRTPGYPAFVAACGGNLTLIRLAQAVLDTSVVLAVFLLARRLAPSGAWAAAVLAAVCPFTVYFTGLVLTETLFTALLVWGTYLLTLGRRRWVLLGLALLAVSVLVRPGALALPLVLATVAALARERRPGFPMPFVAGLLVAACLLPWGWRNSRLLGEWVFTATNAGITAYDGFHPGADGSSNQGAFVPHLPELTEMTETQRNHYLQSLADAHRQADPARAWELAAKKVARTWSPVPLSEENRSPAVIAAGLAYCALAWGLALLGLLSSPAKGSTPTRGLKWLLIAPAVYLTVTAALSVGSLRYRVPAEPLLAVLAAGGVAALASKRASDAPEAAVAG